MTLSRSEEEIVNLSGLYSVFAPLFFALAHRALASADRFFRAAGLIGFRAPAFFADVAAFFGTDLPSRCAHRSLMAAEIRLRAAALIVRVPDPALPGRPRRGLDPSRAAIARSIRFRSSVSAETIWLISMRDSLAAERQRRIPCGRPPRHWLRLWRSSNPEQQPTGRLPLTEDCPEVGVWSITLPARSSSDTRPRSRFLDNVASECCSEHYVRFN